MKKQINKIFTLLTVLLLGFGQMWAAVYATYSVSDLTYTAATLTYEKSGLSGNDQKLNKGERKVEVPCASASGTLYLSGTGANSGRYASIWGTNGTAVDATRKVSMTSGYGDGIAFTSSDILTDGGKYYIIFSNVDGSDFKINAFKYVLSEACSSGPVDPVFTYTPATYTIGDPALDLSTKLTSTNTTGAITFAVSTSDAGTTGASIANDKNFTATTAGTATITVSQEASTGYNAKSQDIEVTVVAAETPVCPSGISISGTAAYTAGETIELTAALTEGNGTISYQWYKGSIAAGNEVGTNSNVLTIASCATSDAGDYFCVASKTSCSDATSSAYAVTVAAVSYCAELYPATSGASPTQKNEELLLQSASYGGKIYTAGAKDNNWSASFTYGANGLSLNKGGADSARVELNHLMKVGTVITATLVNPDASKARGYKLLNMSKTAKATWQAQTTDPQTYTYTVVDGDGLAGTNKFLLNRAESSALKELKVSNCGAELLDLSSAVDPAGEATVTLSANKVLAGGSATATYSIADPTAYDFDEWVVSSGDATIADAHAATAAITMGTTAAVITLKLKTASVKYDVHFDSKGGSTVADQLVEAGGHASVPTAPTKFKYTFGGWSETDGGSTPANLAEIAINAEKTFYAIWTAKVCPTSGTIFSVSANGSKPASEIKWTNADNEGVRDVSDYFNVVNGIAALVNNSSSNNQVSITTDPKMKFSNDANGWLHLRLECALAEGDVITLDNTNTCIVSYTADKAEGTTYTLPNSSSHTVTVPASWAGEDELYVFRNGSNFYITSISIVRPAKFAVTFNMHGHGTQVEAQSIVEGGKVSEPADPEAEGWDFGGWFKESTYDNEWDFNNDVVSATTELHAKWTEHTASSDATLKDLTVGGVTVAGFDPATEEYNVVLEMGTTTPPAVSGTANDVTHVKSVVIMQTGDPTDDATITVTAEDNTTKVYTVHFSVATSKAIQLVFKTGTTPCVGSASTATQILSNNAAVSSYINQITFTNVEGAGDDGAEGSSLNVGKKAGNMFTLSAKAGYALQAMNFLAKIQDDNCEYSINGGAWTELASSSTSADECYAPFASGTVHEFRLRSTGVNGVWIRNMQLTIVEACTPVAITWDEEPVEFEVGKAGQYIAATANTGNDVEYSSNAPLVIAVDAVNGLLSISDLGSATLSASTAEGDGTTYCANGGADIVLSKVVNTYYLVKFDAQNGEEATEVKYFSGDAEIALPAAPSYPGYDFQGWFDAETGGNQYVEDITPAASITVYAQWVAQCDGATITTQPTGASYLTGRTATALVCEATAGAGGALTYEWFTCDDDQKTNPVAATAMPSTATAGTFYYFCKVTEEGCAVEAFSNVVTITVTDKDPICLAWVDVTGQNAASLDASKSLYAPSVSAAGIKNSSTYDTKTGWKFNSSPGYVAIEGAPFKSGDIVEMFVTTTTADKARVFNANEAIAANVVAEGAANMVQGANKVVLTADANNLYLRRGDDFGGWNPYVAYIAVYRACAPILNKVTVAGVDGTPDNTNHVAIEVPASTTDAALEAIAYDWVSNDASWTAAHAPSVANAWEWGVENTLTFADKDGDESVYYVTISKAAASSDATLSALTVNGQAIALVDGVFDYSFELPYGTSAVPTVAATPNHVAAVATVDPCTLSGATITVVPESGAGDQQVYTLTFTISKWKEVVIWDGSYMTNIETSPDGTTGLAWETVGFGSIGSYNTTYGEKSYPKYLPSGGAATSRYMTLTVPAGYVAKFYVVMASHSDGSERGMYIGSNLVKDPDATSVLALSNNDRDVAVAGMSEIVGAGTYYINPNASIDFQEIRAYLRKGMVRDQMLGNGVYGTSCVDHNVAIEDIQGATFYELMGREPQNGKLAFDEIVSGELEAGAPYVFQAHGDKLILFYGETKEDDPVDKGNGMYGTFETVVLTELNDVYYFAQKALWSCYGALDLTIPANRAYVKLSEIDYLTPSQQQPAPGRRRVTMNVNGEQVATGMDQITNDQSPITNKVLINGELFILRGDKMYDATGRLVK